MFEKWKIAITFPIYCRAEKSNESRFASFPALEAILLQKMRIFAPLEDEPEMVRREWIQGRMDIEG